MPDKYVNKVVLGGNTLIDLTSDDVTRGDVLSGKYFHLPSGERVTGTCDYDANTTLATGAAAAGDILTGKSAFVNGNKIDGSMPYVQNDSGTISAYDDTVSIAVGYHDGSGNVSISSTEQAKIIATNIKNGVTILGVTGSYTGSELITLQSKSFTPLLPTPYGAGTGSTIVTFDNGYTGLQQVTIIDISVSDVENSAGGRTITIGAAS